MTSASYFFLLATMLVAPEMSPKWRLRASLAFSALGLICWYGEARS